MLRVIRYSRWRRATCSVVGNSALITFRITGSPSESRKARQMMDLELVKSVSRME
jgi:hypothetical protein